jgi:hypothetical protein
MGDSWYGNMVRGYKGGIRIYALRSGFFASSWPSMVTRNQQDGNKITKSKKAATNQQDGNKASTRKHQNQDLKWQYTTSISHYSYDNSGIEKVRKLAINALHATGLYSGPMTMDEATRAVLQKHRDLRMDFLISLLQRAELQKPLIELTETEEAIRAIFFKHQKRVLLNTKVVLIAGDRSHRLKGTPEHRSHARLLR